MRSGLAEAERFWSKVFLDQDGDGCWEWLGYINPTGYGVFKRKVDGKWKNALAHRYSFEYMFGHRPMGLVCHSCDNPACVRPDHLWDGTHRDNTLDMVAKGRNRGGFGRGEKIHTAKLTEAQVAEIKRDFIPRGKGHGYGNAYDLSTKYGVTVAAISAIGHGKNWSHVSAEGPEAIRKALGVDQ